MLLSIGSDLRLRLAVLVSGLVAACSHPTPPVAQTEAPVAGVFGERLAGHLDLTIVDDVTGEALDLPAILTFADGSTREVSAGAVDDAALVPPLSITVLAPGRPQRWDGIAGSEVIFGVGRYRAGSLHGTLVPDGSEVRIRPLGPARLVRTEQFDRSDSTTTSAFDGFEFALASPVTASGVAGVLYEEGEPVGVVVARGSAELDAPAITLDARTAREGSIARDVPLPDGPGGLLHVVGVPGIAIGDHVALLGYSELGHFVVPRTPDARFWVMARAETGEGRLETAVLQRGLSSLDEIGPWPPWLELPGVELAGEAALTIAVPAGATLVTIDWYFTSDDPVASALVLAPSSTLTVAPPELGFAPHWARVRVLDVPSVREEALDLAAVDREATRYAMIDVDFAP